MSLPVNCLVHQVADQTDEGLGNVKVGTIVAGNLNGDKGSIKHSGWDRDNGTVERRNVQSFKSKCHQLGPPSLPRSGIVVKSTFIKMYFSEIVK